MVQPGVGSDLAQSAFFHRPWAPRPRRRTGPPGLGEFLFTTLNEVLQNPVAALAEGRILPIVVFAILFGVALLHVGERGAARHRVARRRLGRGA